MALWNFSYPSAHALENSLSMFSYSGAHAPERQKSDSKTLFCTKSGGQFLTNPPGICGNRAAALKIDFMELDVLNYTLNFLAKADLTAPALGMTMLERYIDREQ